VQLYGSLTAEYPALSTTRSSAVQRRNLDRHVSSMVLQHTGSGKVKPRPNVLRLMDEARDEGLKVAVCSAATKSSCIFVVEQMLGPDRYRVSAAGLNHAAHGGQRLTQRQTWHHVS
jgi:hypothetical protein